MDYVQKKNMILNDNIKEICREFYQRASDNGTVLHSYDCETEGPTETPIIDCGISLFIILKGGSKCSFWDEFDYRDMEICYNWSQSRVKGGWGNFEVNLPEKEIREFQLKLEKVFCNPQNYLKEENV